MLTEEFVIDMSLANEPLKWKRGPESSRKGRAVLQGESDGTSSRTESSGPGQVSSRSLVEGCPI